MTLHSRLWKSRTSVWVVTAKNTFSRVSPDLAVKIKRHPQVATAECSWPPHLSTRECMAKLVKEHHEKYCDVSLGTGLRVQRAEIDARLFRCGNRVQKTAAIWQER